MRIINQQTFVKKSLEANSADEILVGIVKPQAEIRFKIFRMKDSTAFMFGITSRTKLPYLQEYCCSFESADVSAIDNGGQALEVEELVKIAYKSFERVDSHFRQESRLEGIEYGGGIHIKFSKEKLEELILIAMKEIYTN